MKIATYNVNSVNARLPNLLAWLDRCRPDVVLLQEIKCEFNAFPFFDLQLAGYEAKIFGQKSYNGVAVLSRGKIEVAAEGLPGFEDENARYLEVLVDAGGENIRVASVYLPNGNPPYNAPDDDSKYAYKLAWMDAFYAHARKLSESGEKVVFGGDFNVILTEADVYNPDLFRNNALFREEVKQRLKAFEYLGFYDAFRCLHPYETGYTYWDYSGSAVALDNGMRIDYFWLSPAAADGLKSCGVDKQARLADKPSDHAPLVMEFF